MEQVEILRKEGAMAKEDIIEAARRIWEAECKKHSQDSRLSTVVISDRSGNLKSEKQSANKSTARS